MRSLLVRFLCVVFVAQGTLVSGVAAQDAEDPWAGVEEILVIGTGAGSLGLLSETGSVTEFGAEDLAALGIENTTDLADFTPNLEIVQNTATTATFFIRGVGLQDFSANAAGAIAIYLDGMPLNTPTLQVAPIFDSGGVEVFKGPQGRGNFRNATGGVIAISSAKPDLSAPFFSASTSQGSVVSVDAIDAYLRSYEGAFSVPIITDILAARFAFRTSDRDPIFTNRCGLQPDQPFTTICGESNGVAVFGRSRVLSGLNKEVGLQSVYSLRGSVLLAPPSDYDFQILTSVFYSKRDQDGSFGQAIGTGQGNVSLGASTATDGNQRVDPVTGRTTFGVYVEPDTAAELRELIDDGFRDFNMPFGRDRLRFDALAKNFGKHRPLDRHPYTGDFNQNGKQLVEIIGGTTKWTADFESFNVSMTAGVARTETISEADTDYIPNTLFEIDTKNNVTQASADLVFEGEIEAYAVTWEVGGYFLWEDLESNTFTDLVFNDSVRQSAQDTFSTGIFAGFEVDFLEDFTLSAGGRFNRERKQFEIAEQLIGIVGGDSVASDELTWMEPTGTVHLKYRFSESTSAYLKFNHGFKPGHFNSNGTSFSATGAAVREPASPEFVDSWEIGLQGSYWEDRVKFNGALFHYSYKDYQVFVFEDVPSGGPSIEITNANDARVIGAEVELVLRPLEGYVPEQIEGLQLTLAGGWLDSVFLDFKNSSVFRAANSTFEIVSDFTGNQLLNSPEFTLNGGMQWDILLGRFGEIQPRWDFSWRDDTYFDASEGQGPNRPDGALLPEFTLGQRSFILHNVRLTYKPVDSPVTIAGWCRNVADERYKSYAFDVSRFRGVVVNFVGDPRTCGADISFTF